MVCFQDLSKTCFRNTSSSVLEIQVQGTPYNEPFIIVNPYEMVCILFLLKTNTMMLKNMNTIMMIIVKTTVFVTTVMMVIINNDDIIVIVPSYSAVLNFNPNRRPVFKI